MQQYRKLERNQLVAQLWEMTARIQEIAPGLPKLADLKERIRIECPMALDDGDRVTIEEGGTRHQGVVETSGEVKYITLESGERRALDVIAPARIRYDAEDKTLLDTIYAARSGSVTSDVLPTDASHTRSAMTGFVVGLVGCSLLLLGVFAPIVSAPIVGELNYFRNGEGDGVIVLGLMGVAVVMILARVIRYLLIPGIGSLLLVLYTFINLRVTLSREHDQVQAQLGDNPFRALADVGLGLVQLEYGWALLLLGALFLIIASALAPPAARYQK